MTMAMPTEILEHQRRLHALQDAHGTALGMETRDPLCAGEEFPSRCRWGRGAGSLQRSRVALCNSLNETSTMEQKIHLPSHLHAYTCWTVCFILALTLLHSSLIPGQMQKPQPILYQVFAQCPVKPISAGTLILCGTTCSCSNTQPQFLPSLKLNKALYPH